MVTALTDQQKLLYPLSLFYLNENKPLPEVEPRSGQALPEPYRQLLDHANDMTPTLEAFHGQSMTLRVLHSHRRQLEFLRRVVLLGEDDGKPAEYGAIAINLRAFPEPAQRLILECRVPLGTIMSLCDVTHGCEPQSFFAIECDDEIRRGLRLRQRKTLYGRRNILRSESGDRLAEVVEVLAPSGNSKE